MPVLNLLGAFAVVICCVCCGVGGMQKRSMVRLKELYLVMSIVLPFFVVCCLVCSFFLFWLLKYFVIVYVVLAFNH